MSIKNLLYQKLKDCVYPSNTPQLNESNSTYLGTTTIQEVPDQIDNFFRVRFTHFNNRTKWFFIFRDLIEDLFIRRRFVSYAEYQALHSEKSSDFNALIAKQPIYKLLNIHSNRQRIKIINTFPNSLIGYYKLMFLKNKRLYNLYTEPLEVRLPEDLKRTHSYCVGSTKSGKSELLKNLIIQDIGKNNKSIIIIEPNGDLASEIFRQNNIDQNRLIYIDCSLPNVTPVLNPFEFVKKEDNLEIEKQIQIIRIAFEQVCKEFGSEVSLQMQSILTPCLDVIARKGGTLLDLRRFMVSGTNEDLIEFGLTIPKLHDFFEHTFDKPHLNVSKQGIFQKLTNILNFSSLTDFFCGKSTIDLEKAMEEKKIIIFNLSKGKLGALASESIGKMVIAIIQNLIFQRASVEENKRFPTAIYLDEFQDIVNESIISLYVQGRKYNVSINVACQIIGQKMTSEMTKTILGNTSVTYSGRNGFDTLNRMSREAYIDVEELRNLPPGKFFTTIDKANGFILTVPSKHLGSSTCINHKEYQILLNDQINKYYIARPVFKSEVSLDKNIIEPPEKDPLMGKTFKPKF